MSEPTGGSPPLSVDELAEAIARESHVRYERFSEAHGWQSRGEGKSFDEQDDSNKQTMVATFRGLLLDGVIEPGPATLAHFPAADAGGHDAD